ncbi:MAG: glycosyltransferase family 39 protein [Phycisphaerae bacterium]
MSTPARTADLPPDVVVLAPVEPPRRSLAPLVCVLISICLHAAFTWHELAHRAGGAIRFDDERNYYLFCADGFARDGWRFLASEASLRAPPLAWLVPYLAGRSVAATRIVNIAICLAAAGLTARVANRHFGPRVACATYLVAACHFPVVEFAGTVLSEPPAYFGLSLSIWAIDRAARCERGRTALLAGAALGLTALARASFTLLAPAAALALLWTGRRAARHRTNWSARRCTVLLAGWAIVVAPWIAKNWIALGAPRVASGLGAVLFLGSDLRTHGDEPPFHAMAWQTGPVTAPDDHMQIAGEQRLVRRRAGQYRRPSGALAAAAPRKAWRLLIGGPKWHFFPADSLSHALLRRGRAQTVVRFAWWTLGGTAVTLIGLAGLVLWRRAAVESLAGAPAAAALGAAARTTVVYLLLLHTATYAIPRFSMPLAGLLALGCGALLARRAAVLTLALLAASLLLAIGTARWHDWYPAHVVPADESMAFTLDRRAAFEAARDCAVARFEPLAPAFNTCIFIGAAPHDGDRESHDLEIEPGYGTPPQFDAAAAIRFASGPRGAASGGYRLCIEQLVPWKRPGLTAIRFRGAPPRPQTVVIAH